MPRPRQHMESVLKYLDELRGKSVSSRQIAEHLSLNTCQVRHAMKVLLRNREVHGSKDPASARGYLYRCATPPAFVFVDPSLFDTSGVMGSMARELLQERFAANDFSILNDSEKIRDRIQGGLRA